MMKISVRDLSFGYAGKIIFDNFSVDLDGGTSGRPLVILGPSGSGKTTLLKLIGGLLKSQNGDILFSPNPCSPKPCIAEHCTGKPRVAFMFQEPRLLPWLTVLENVILPLEKDLGREEARSRAGHFLSLVSLSDKVGAYPKELSGGEAQRVSLARAFAWPAPLLLMDEPFQSLDIPLRLNLMDLAMSLLESENAAKEEFSKNHFLVSITHDPREAVYMAGRIIVLGRPGEGIVFDRIVDLRPDDRAYGSAAAAELEREIIQALKFNDL